MDHTKALLAVALQLKPVCCIRLGRFGTENETGRPNWPGNQEEVFSTDTVDTACVLIQANVSLVPP